MSNRSAVPPPLDWRSVDLVVFDVDGTLYDQSRLRMRMAGELAIASLAADGLKRARIIKVYREERERLAEARSADFKSELAAAAMSRTGASATEVEQAVEEWMMRRPLRHLPDCRYDGVVETFARLKDAGKTIAAWSDYPAAEKLSALGLRADIVLAAGDPGAPRLKPDPQGLLYLLDQAGVAPARALMIGDRVERDGEAARAAGVDIMIRSRRRLAAWRVFRDYSDPVFKSIEPATR